MTGGQQASTVRQDPAEPPQAPRVVACPRCGAVNAGSRIACARCGINLRADPEDLLDQAGPSTHAGATVVVDDDVMAVPGSLVLLATVVSVVALAIALTLLSARGIGPFAGPGGGAGIPTESATVSIESVSASSQLPAERRTTYVAQNVVDNDPATAWNEGESGDGESEWLQLELERPSVVSGLLVWNGYQSGDFFAKHNRVRRLRVTLNGVADTDARVFTVQLLDRRGPQAITLPESVRAETIRLEVVQTFPGTVYNDTALSEIQVRGTAVTTR